MDGEAVVVNTARQKAWVLNATATRLWKALLGKTGISDGCGLSLSQLAQELECFRDQLAGAGLVEGAASGGPALKQSFLNPPPVLRIFLTARSPRKIRPNSDTPIP
jgi:hypothetical protein